MQEALDSIAPLFKLRLTALGDGNSILAASWLHVLADGRSSVSMSALGLLCCSGFQFLQFGTVLRPMTLDGAHRANHYGCKFCYDTCVAIKMMQEPNTVVREP